MKKDPLFADKSRWGLFEKIRESSEWIDKKTNKVWHPAQEDYLRTYLWLLEDCDWIVKGKKWSVITLVNELSTHSILRDKKPSFIESRIYRRRSQLYNSVLNEETLLEEKEKRSKVDPKSKPDPKPKLAAKLKPAAKSKSDPTMNSNTQVKKKARVTEHDLDRMPSVMSTFGASVESLTQQSMPQLPMFVSNTNNGSMVPIEWSNLFLSRPLNGTDEEKNAWVEEVVRVSGVHVNFLSL